MKKSEEYELQLYRVMVKQNHMRPSEFLVPLKQWIEALIKEAIIENKLVRVHINETGDKDVKKKTD